MIAKSDLLILVVSASALAFGVYRWQQNVSAPAVATAPAAARAVDRSAAEPPAPRSAPRLAFEAAPDAAPVLNGAPARTDEVEDARDDGGVVVRRLSADERRDAADGGRPVTDVTANRPAATERQTPAVTDDAAVAASGGNAGEPLYGVYRVREGDYLGRIADQVGTSVSALRSLNGIEGNLILVDQELRYPLPAN